DANGTTRNRGANIRNDCGAARDAEAFVVAIDRVWNQHVERNTRLRIKVAGNDKLPRRLVTAVELKDVRPIIRQASIKSIEQADQVEQRGDVRVRLSVVVAEQAFVVTDQARVHIRSDELIVVRKTLRSGELNCAIVTTSWSEALC